MVGGEYFLGRDAGRGGREGEGKRGERNGERIWGQSTEYSVAILT